MSPKARVLVVANRTADSPELIAALLRRSTRSPARFTLLVPAVPRGLAWAADMKAGGPEAADRAETGVRRMRMSGLEVAAAIVGDPDPVAAVGDALLTGPFDEVVVSTLPRGVSRWLKLSLPHRPPAHDERSRRPRRCSSSPAIAGAPGPASWRGSRPEGQSSAPPPPSPSPPPDRLGPVGVVGAAGVVGGDGRRLRHGGRLGRGCLRRRRLLWVPGGTRPMRNVRHRRVAGRDRLRGEADLLAGEATGGDRHPRGDCDSEQRQGDPADRRVHALSLLRVRESDRGARPAPLTARQRHLATPLTGQLTGDRQSETGATGPAPPCAAAAETLEDGLLLTGLQPRSAIEDLDSPARPRSSPSSRPASTGRAFSSSASIERSRSCWERTTCGPHRPRYLTSNSKIRIAPARVRRQRFCRSFTRAWESL